MTFCASILLLHAHTSILFWDLQSMIKWFKLNCSNWKKLAISLLCSFTMPQKQLKKKFTQADRALGIHSFFCIKDLVNFELRLAIYIFCQFSASFVLKFWEHSCQYLSDHGCKTVSNALSVSLSIFNSFLLFLQQGKIAKPKSELFSIW